MEIKEQTTKYVSYLLPVPNERTLKFYMVQYCVCSNSILGFVVCDASDHADLCLHDRGQ